MNDKPNYDLSSIVLLQEDIRFEINLVIPFTTLKGYVDNYEQFCGVNNHPNTENKTQLQIQQSPQKEKKFFNIGKFNLAAYIKLPFQFDFGKFINYEEGAVGLFDLTNVFLPLSVSDDISKNPNVVWEGGVRILPLIALIIIITIVIAITRIYKSNKKMDFLSSVENTKKEKTKHPN